MVSERHAFKPAVLLGFVLLISCCSLSVAFGQTYYVSITGNNNNAGTLANPWRNIWRAMNSVQNGDTVYLRGGTYTEADPDDATSLVLVPLGGITIAGYTGETVIIDGVGLSANNAINLQSYKNITIQNLTIRNVRDFAVVGVSDTDNITLRNLSISGANSAAIKFQAGVDRPATFPTNGASIASGLTLENITINNCLTGMDLGPGAVQGVIIRNASLTGSGTSGETYEDGIAVEFGQNVLIEDVIVQGYPGDGIDLKADDVTVRRVKVLNQGRDSVKLWGTNTILENSLVAGGGLTSLVLEGAGPYTISNNTIGNSRLYGYMGTLGPYGSNAASVMILKNNIFFNQIPANGGTLLYFSPGASITAQGNMVYQPYRDDSVIVISHPNGSEDYYGVTEFNNNQWPAGFSSSNNYYRNPLFISSGDFHLQSTSQAINKGVVISGLTVDLEKNPRPQGSSYDIGAYEYGSSASGSVTLSVTPTTSAVLPGQSVNYTVNLARSNAADAVTLSVNGLPTGATPVFGTNPVTGNSTTLTVNTSSNSPIGTSTLTISGSATGLSVTPATVSLSLNSLAPSITSFNPTSGGTGTSVVITGANFTGVSSVMFNNSNASFTFNSATQITATVSSGATTGIIRVTTSAGIASSAAAFTVPTGAPSINAPASTVRLIFIHHSTGENWLSDDNGTLGLALRNNNYFVSDTNYGWGPNDTGNIDGVIGDYTDIGHWWAWFRGPNSSTILNAVYSETGQNASYSRLASNPGGPNQIIMFKSCFPNSALAGPASPVPAIGSNLLVNQDAYSSDMTVANAKGIYIDILEYIRAHQEKLFIVIAAPPLIDGTYGSNARSFNNWLTSPTGWLNGYAYNNVFVFDFYNVLTHANNHHRWNAATSSIDHIVAVAQNTTAYPSGDDHPSQAGNLKATTEFLPLLNYAYNRWKASTPPPPPPTITSFDPSSGFAGSSATINGTNFSSVLSVTFSGATSIFSVTSSVQITATVPAGAPVGPGPIVVTTSGGFATSSTNFTVITPPPAITSFAPAIATIGETVTLNGTNLSGATAVTFNGTPATTFIIDSATLIRADVPVGATTGLIAVTTPGGTATSAANFSPDSDGDGLSDEQEADLGTDPSNPDSDADTYNDGLEVNVGTNPLLNTSYPLVLRISADNIYWLYVNGVLKGSNGTWTNAEDFYVKDTDSLALKVQDLRAPGGFIAEIINNSTYQYGTNFTWKATITVPSNWMNPSFDDRTWPFATEIAAYGQGVWGARVSPALDARAKWIWLTTPGVTPPLIVYFRTKVENRNATVKFTCDNFGELLINGVSVLSTSDWRYTYSRSTTLSPGNTLRISGGDGEGRAACLGEATWEVGGVRSTLVTDSFWTGYVGSSTTPQNVIVAGAVGMAPWYWGLTLRTINASAKWIWAGDFYTVDNVGLERVIPNETLYFAADNGYTAYWNGVQIATGNNWMQSGTVQVFASAGDVFAAKVTDAGVGIGGFLTQGQGAFNFMSDTSWSVYVPPSPTALPPAGWNTRDFVEDFQWVPASTFGAYGISPWGKRVAGFPTASLANWIWASDNSNINVIYLRKKMS